ncbi:AAA family ATPase [Pedobacter sp.]
MTTKTFITKPANDWIQEASLKPIPQMLFNEFWFENELCILYGDANCGKSILAVDIANKITKGINDGAFKSVAKKKKVLYLDFELNAKQLETRYSDNYINHYQFDGYFIRSELNFDANVFLNTNKIAKQIEDEIISQNTSIIIIDNLTYLCNDAEKGTVALELMKRLKEMKSRFNLSILVLSHTPKRMFDRPITSNDLQGSKMLMNFCDSSFAIGKSYLDGSLRYLKQIKQRNCEQIYSEDNVMVCKLSKGLQNNFLHFEFVDYDSEYNHLNYERTKSKEQQKQEAKELKSDGLTNVEIARRLSVTEGTIRNWLDK